RSERGLVGTREVGGRQETLEDQVVETGLAELDSPHHRKQALPAPLEEVPQGYVGLDHRGAADLVEQPGHPGKAPPTLTRAHPHSHITADVVDGAGVTFHDRPGDVGPSGQLTLAHEVAVGALAFDPGETLTQPLMPAALPMVGDRLEVGATGPIHTEL